MTFFKYLKHVSLVVAWLFVANSLFGERIVFDLGYVLFAPSKFAISRQLGWGTCARYFLRERHKFEDLRKVFFQVLNNVPTNVPPFDVAGDEVGNRMSGIMCEQQAGIKTCQQVLEEITATIDRLTQENFFSSACERTLIERLTKTVFDPQLHAQIMFPIKQGVELVKLLAAEKDADGNPRHELMILSNFSDEAFQLLYKKYPEIFKYFKPEKIFISSRFKCFAGLKPSPLLYQHVMAKTQSPANDIVFLDDQLVNCQGAEFCGWSAIQVKNGNFTAVKQELKTRGLIKR